MPVDRCERAFRVLAGWDRGRFGRGFHGLHCYGIAQRVHRGGDPRRILFGEGDGFAVNMQCVIVDGGRNCAVSSGRDRDGACDAEVRLAKFLQQLDQSIRLAVADPQPVLAELTPQKAAQARCARQAASACSGGTYNERLLPSSR